VTRRGVHGLRGPASRINRQLNHSRLASRLLTAALGLAFAIVFTVPASAAELRLAWTNNLLTVSSRGLPGGSIQIWYLEAFCRHGSTRQDWSLTTIPHATELLSIDPNQQTLRLRSKVQPDVEVIHQIRAGPDELDFDVTFVNRGSAFADVQWFQPCIRVDRFTNRQQSNYTPRCFIFTKRGLTTLDRTARREDAIYRGGQVYVPSGVDLNDVNPRPISPDVPVNGLIGCFSADDQMLLATAWDQTQELFQGVIVCLHNDPRVGGLQPGETKHLRGKVYLMKNDPATLLARYRKDFPTSR
jgi:hypothetical protein